jgi:hypothetical protein
MGDEIVMIMCPDVQNVWLKHQEIKLFQGLHGLTKVSAEFWV